MGATTEEATDENLDRQVEDLRVHFKENSGLLGEEDSESSEDGVDTVFDEDKDQKGSYATPRKEYVELQDSATFPVDQSECEIHEDDGDGHSEAGSTTASEEGSAWVLEDLYATRDDTSIQVDEKATDSVEENQTALVASAKVDSIVDETEGLGPEGYEEDESEASDSETAASYSVEEIKVEEKALEVTKEDKPLPPSEDTLSCQTSCLGVDEKMSTTINSIRNETTDPLPVVSAIIEFVQTCHPESNSPFAKSRAELYKLEGTAAILQAMKHWNANAAIQEAGCVALQNVSNDTDTFNKSVKENGTFVVIIQAIKNHSETAAIQEAGIGALTNMVQLKENAHHFVNDLDGIDCVLVSMKKFPENGNLQRLASMALYNLVVHGFGNELRSAGGERILSKTIESFPDKGQAYNKDIHHYAGRAVEIMSALPK